MWLECIQMCKSCQNLPKIYIFFSFLWRAFPSFFSLSFLPHPRDSYASTWAGLGCEALSQQPNLRAGIHSLLGLSSYYSEKILPGSCGGDAWMSGKEETLEAKSHLQRRGCVTCKAGQARLSLWAAAVVGVLELRILPKNLAPPL